MRQELQITADGSHTLFVPELNEHYHSVNGAVQESMHVFIDAGLRKMEKEEVRILEIGFGTGLNAFLTLREMMQAGRPKRVEYYAVERYPLAVETAEVLNYGETAWREGKQYFIDLHRAVWGMPVAITDRFVPIRMSPTCQK